MYNSNTGQAGCNFINGLPEESCRFMDSEGFDPRYGSIMYRQYLDHVSFILTTVTVSMFMLKIVFESYILLYFCNNYNSILLFLDLYICILNIQLYFYDNALFCNDYCFVRSKFTYLFNLWYCRFSTFVTTIPMMCSHYTILMPQTNKTSCVMAGVFGR